MRIFNSIISDLIILILLFCFFLILGNRSGNKNHSEMIYGNSFNNNINNLLQAPSCKHIQTWKLKKNGSPLTLKWITDTAYFTYTKNLRKSTPAKGTVQQQMVYAATISKNMLGKSMESFNKLIRDENLNYKKAAETLVSAVQNMPYYRVEPGSCSSTNSNLCIPEIPYGLLFPIEAIVYFGGDCDSKTLLLYCMLKQLGYDAAIVSSESNDHVLLGIAGIPLNGYSVEGENKKYYLWETSEAGWIPGDIPKKLLASNDLKIIYKN